MTTTTLPNHLKSIKENKFFECNQWIAPDFNSLYIHKQNKFLLNGHGGEIDQSVFYFDPEGTSNWLTLSENRDYNPGRHVPFDRVAESILYHQEHNHFEEKNIHIFGLGCGNGTHEIQLVNRLYERTSNITIYLYLIDLSPFMLNEAYQKARHAFESRPSIKLISIQGNFENLSSYHPIIQLAKESKELIVLTMFGATLTNLKNEQWFLRNSLRVFPKNTLFLTDILLANAPTNNPELIRKKDPRLSGQFGWGHTAEETKFLLSPLKLHRTNLEKVHLSQDIDYSSCFEGSYAVEIRAIVNDEVPFTLMRVKRYEAKKLAQVMIREGFEALEAFPYGLEDNPRMLYLLSKI